MINFRRKAHITIVVFVLVFSLNSVAHATNGLKLIGLGPVQRAMGGVSAALPLDSATTVTNPAGMSELGGRVDLGVTTIIPVSNYEAISAAGLVMENGATIKSDTNPFILPAVGLIIPINEDFTFGLGIYSVSGAGVDYRSNLYNNVTYTCYTASKVAPALSYKINDAFIVGIAPSFDFANFAFEAAVAALNPAHSNASAYGIGYTIGTLIKPLELISDEDLPDGLSRDFINFGIAYESKQWFSRFEYNTTGGKDKLEFDLPQNLTFGVALKPTKSLKLGFDVVWIDWSSTLGNNKPRYVSKSTASSDFNVNWTDQYVFKVGAELDVLEDDVVKKLTLRAGYNYGKSPAAKDRPFENIALPCIAEHHLTWGAGIKFTEKLGLNLNFMYSPKKAVETSNISAFINEAKSEVTLYSIDIGVFYEF